jgi:hypothetical protein
LPAPALDLPLVRAGTPQCAHLIAWPHTRAAPSGPPRSFQAQPNLNRQSKAPTHSPVPNNPPCGRRGCPNRNTMQEMLRGERREAKAAAAEANARLQQQQQDIGAREARITALLAANAKLRGDLADAQATATWRVRALRCFALPCFAFMGFLFQRAWRTALARSQTAPARACWATPRRRAAKQLTPRPTRASSLTAPRCFRKRPPFPRRGSCWPTAARHARSSRRAPTAPTAWPRSLGPPAPSCPSPRPARPRRRRAPTRCRRS